MGPFFEHVFTLLTSETGSLTYHLVLAFSIAGALQATIGRWRRDGLLPARRAVAGLALLLLLRLALYVGGALVWQGLVNAGNLLPLLERLVNLLSLIVLIWLWAFPETLRAADSATLLLGLLTLTMFILGTVWWTGQSAASGFNASWPDTIASGFALLLAALGALLLFVRRPAGWGFGLAMLALLMVGYAVDLIFPPAAGNYSGVLRLAYMAAFPLLLALPQRFAEYAPTSPPVPAPVQAIQERPAGPDPQILSSALRLALETEPAKLCQAVTATISRALVADMCLLVSPPDDTGQIILQCGYDLIREVSLPGAALEGAQLPLLAAHLQRGRPLRLPASATSPDLANLARFLELSRPGNLLAVPLIQEDGKPLLGILLLSPYSDRNWTADDQAALADVAHTLVRVLGNARHVEGLKDELESARQEKQQFLDQIGALQAGAGQDRSQLESLAAMIATNEDAQETILQLQAENETLKQQVEALASRPAAAGEASGDLRVALEEIATLRSALDEADRKIHSLGVPSGESPSPQRLQELAAIAQELRQPMASVSGYVDFLMGESVGILGALQRKFLERVKVSTERMSRLVDDLIRQAGPESGQSTIAPTSVDLSATVDEAIASITPRLNDKDVALRLDLPGDLPCLETDPGALQDILLRLLQNAGEVTPSHGEVLLRVRQESSDGKQDYLLLQVKDTGEGFSSTDLPRVFSQLNRPKTASSISLDQVKTLVEKLGGRIWVDSRPGQGATFSVVLPLISSRPSPNGRQAG